MRKRTIRDDAHDPFWIQYPARVRVALHTAPTLQAHKETRETAP